MRGVGSALDGIKGLVVVEVKGAVLRGSAVVEEVIVGVEECWVFGG